MMKFDISRCEVQFDYGLRQKRFKKLEERPASFTSAEGKKIFVEKKVAAQNDRSLQRGKVCATT
jgi:exonuclease V